MPPLAPVTLGHVLEAEYKRETLRRNMTIASRQQAGAMEQLLPVSDLRETFSWSPAVC